MSLPINDLDQIIRRLYDGGLSHGSEDYSRWALRQVVEILGLGEVAWSRENSRMEPLEEARFARTASERPATVAPVTVSVPGQSGTDWHRLQFLPHGNAFSDVEADALRRLAPYLVHAEWMHRQIVQTRMSGALRRIDGQAVVDAAGKLLSCDSAFRELMSPSFPNWEGQSLPVEIDWPSAGGRSGQVVKNLRLYASRLGELVQIRLCRVQTHDSLSAREIEVARLIARGRTFKEAAKELDLAPSTVSTHLYSLYDKLGIKGRAELIDWLIAQRDWI